MPVINQPPMMKTIMGDLDKRVRKLEQSPSKRPYGSFFSSSTQTAASSASVYAVECSQTALTNFVTVVSSSRVTAARTGVYNMQFSCQLQNSGTHDYDAMFWFRHNGVDEPSSNTVITVPGKHGHTPGSAVAAWNYVNELTAGDYMELMWWVENTAVTMPAVAALTSPVRPAVPSVIVTMVETAW
jgi:hypothetical protein